MNRKEFFGLLGQSMIGGSLFLSGCSHLLDQMNPNTLSPQTFWKTADDAEAGLTSIFQVFYQSSPAAMYDWEDRLLVSLYRGDDIGITHDVPYWWTIALHTLNAGNQTVTDSWSKNYTGIFRANQVVSNVPDISMDDDLKNRIVGEAKFLRAFYYFVLLINYRNIPLILGSSNGDDKYSVPQSSPEEVWAQIEGDLKDAVNVLPVGYGESELGHITKGAALGYLGKAYLFQKKWSDAVAVFEDIITAKHYDLVPDFKDVFSVNNEFNEETLFEINFSATAQKGVTISSFRNREEGLSEGGGWHECFPNEWLFQEMTKEKTEAGKLDPRVYHTILWNGSGMKYYGQKYEDLIGSDGTKTGWMKYSDAELDHPITDYTGRNDRVLRYADILLMHAEAVVQSGGTLQDAIGSINKVRTRAGLTPMSGSGMNKTTVLREIEHQRVCELAEEGTRWYDLLRWEGSIDGSLTIKQCLTQHGAIGAATFDPKKHKYLPIPLSEIDTNSKIKQNNGY